MKVYTALRLTMIIHRRFDQTNAKNRYIKLKGEKVMRSKLIMLGFIISLALTASARAQVLIDASKITCDQFVHSKLGPPRLMAAWFSGFYNGKRDNLIVDTQNFQDNLSQVERFCYDEK